MRQLGQLDISKAEFDARDARVWVATTYDAPTVRGWVKKKGYGHRFLVSAGGLVEAMGLVNERHPDKISQPATFVLAPDGTVLLADRTEVSKREPMADILAAIDAHRGE